MIEKISLRMGLDQELIWEFQRELLGSKVGTEKQDYFARIGQDEFAVISD